MAATKFRNIPFDTITIAISASDTADLVAAVSGFKILVWSLHVRTGDGTKSLTFKTGTTSLTGAMLGTSFDFDAVTTGECAQPVFETVVSEKFAVTASAAVAIAGFMTYSLAKE